MRESGVGEGGGGGARQRQAGDTRCRLTRPAAPGVAGHSVLLWLCHLRSNCAPCWRNTVASCPCRRGAHRQDGGAGRRPARPRRHGRKRRQICSARRPAPLARTASSSARPSPASLCAISKGPAQLPSQWLRSLRAPAEARRSCRSPLVPPSPRERGLYLAAPRPSTPSLVSS